MNSQVHIIVVEDHDIVRDELVAFLTRPEWHVRGVDCGEGLDIALHQHPANIAIIDLNLPGEDGLSISQRLRRALPDIGIILLTARVLPMDKIAGYQSGADVYLTKPANIGELEAVVINLTQRIKRWAHHNLQLNMSKLTLELSLENSISLTLTEANLLYELSLAPKQCIDTEILIHHLDSQHKTHLSRENLPVIISRLRTKISDGLGINNSIKAVRNYGYKLTTKITVQEY
ncbi:MAG: response regulator transcription factor [Burkholderiaceae bacterium]|nr:response regulator transcription factor [Burkholderiaceae bacterium]